MNFDAEVYHFHYHFKGILFHWNGENSLFLTSWKCLKAGRKSFEIFVFTSVVQVNLSLTSQNIMGILPTSQNIMEILPTSQNIMG